ncbi:MAG TPA: glycoside hydrolase family 2 TIM barrel-domain containing protein [Candidatus Dormibacteraeota bacterium]|nr:glycoside hydrolase family 2 TIM barrel-domain containing protein [Candidatus Dormibacteraeota bacterium]
MPRAVALISTTVLLLSLAAPACSLVPPSGRADLTPTLKLTDVAGGPVAFEAGQPVPTFDRQPRLQINLDGQWRFEPQSLDSSLSLMNRKNALSDITADVGSRTALIYDDSQWSSAGVPGTFNPPPSRETTGGYYRQIFFVAPDWSGKYALLKFGAVRYVADVWLNGRYLGYHEGGDTPLALDATQALIPGAYNVLMVRVDNPEWGTRDDIVPWGLADWWNYGGIVGDVWMEAVPSLSVVRADVTPHLDGADVSIVIQHRGSTSSDAAVDVRLWPAQITSANLLDPNASSLIPADSVPLLYRHISIGSLSGESVFRVPAPFSIRSADLWSPSFPALYVLQVTALDSDAAVDDIYTSFGLRQIKVDSTGPRLLFNGTSIVFNGVSMHEERQEPPQNGDPAGGPLTSPAEIESILGRALSLHADLIRVDHHPPNQMLPILADRLGVGLWEEIPLYHFTPQTFTIATDRGIAQQMLAEMDLRDFNRPSVLFHGFSNESSGDGEHRGALNTLQAVDRRIDGTRLTGQAIYGTDLSDRTSSNLDVAGYTFYYGVLYGGRLKGAEIQSVLIQAHQAYPRKPIMVLEYGRWTEQGAAGDMRQLSVFDTYQAQLKPDFGTEPGGFIGAALWWSLDDYWTQRPGITIERFGLFRPDGTLRPAGAAAQRQFALTAPATTPPAGRTSGVANPIISSERNPRLLPYLAYAFALPAIALIVVIFALSRVRRRAW